MGCEKNEVMKRERKKMREKKKRRHRSRKREWKIEMWQVKNKNKIMSFKRNIGKKTESIPAINRIL